MLVIKKMEQGVADAMLLDGIHVDVEVPVVDELQLGWKELMEPAMSMVAACSTNDNTEIETLAAIGSFTTGK